MRALVIKHEAMGAHATNLAQRYTHATPVTTHAHAMLITTHAHATLITPTHAARAIACPHNTQQRLPTHIPWLLC